MTYAWSKGSTRAWRRARARQIQEQPLCQDCLAEDRLTSATDVHHPEPLAAGGDRFDPRNMTSLCREHHQRRHGARPKADVDPATGLPRGDHWWNDE